MQLRKTSFIIAASSAFALLAVPPNADAFLGFGKKPEVLTADDLAAQEAAASKLLASARAEEPNISTRKARSRYGDIVKDYPRTASAGEAQFKIGELREQEGKSKKAFAEYQDFLTEYRDSPRFAEAVKRQYDIALALMQSDKKGFLGIGAAIQPSDLIEMFEQISANAPFSEYAPLSLYNIGVVNRTQNDIDAAIDAFDAVVQEYPDSHLKAEAMKQKFEMLGTAADRSNNPQNVRHQREAGEDALNQLTGEEAAEMRAKMGKLEEKEKEKNFDIARFYEGQGDFKAAAVYYREVISKPSGSKFEQLAKERLAGLIEADPSIGAVPPRRAAPKPSASNVVTSSDPAPAPTPTPTPTKERADYLGPPIPENIANKPAMRTSADDVVPIP
jgi:outer membrane protein assembly factor BamD